LSNCIGNNKGNYNIPTQQETAEYIAGIKEKIFTKEQQDRMDYGTKNEEYARKWYTQQNECIVKEMGFAIPKFDLRIGVSLDGLVLNLDETETDGIIEIKCPQKMYKPLKLRKEGRLPHTEEYDHIWRSHYDQMQMGMAVFNKKWCDYIVFCIPENNVYIERVFFNQYYWNKVMKLLDDFIITYLNPALEIRNKQHISVKYPLMPPS